MEEYTHRRGIVVSVEPGSMVVRVERDDEPGCDGCGSCALKSLCRGRGENSMDLPVDSPGDRFRPGDAVGIRYRLPNQAVAALALFIPPLVGLLLGGLAGARLGGDWTLLAGCLAGLAAGVGGTFLVSRFSAAMRPEVALDTPGSGG